MSDGRLPLLGKGRPQMNQTVTTYLAPLFSGNCTTLLDFLYQNPWLIIGLCSIVQGFTQIYDKSTLYMSIKY